MSNHRYFDFILTMFLVSIIIAASIPGSTRNQYDAMSPIQEPEAQPTIIEGIREYSLSAETTDYVDYSYDPTFGSHSNEPSNGMGQDSEGSVGARTVLTESSQISQTWVEEDDVPTFSSLPSGWASSEITYSGGYFEQTPYGSFPYGGYIISADVNTIGSNEVKFTLDIGGDWAPQTVSVSFYNGATWDRIGSYSDGGGDGVVRTQTFSSASALYRIANFKVQVHYGLFDSGGQWFQANGWLLEVEYDYNYQAFQAVYRFDTVDFDIYSIEEIYIDYSDGFPSSENLAYRFAAGDPTPNNIIMSNSDGETNFSVDVHSYVTGDTCYLDIRDTNRADSDDTSNSWYIDRVYLLLTEPEPSWDDIPLDQVLEYPEELAYQLNATLAPAVDTWWTDNPANFAIDGSGVLRNVTKLPVDVYNLQVFVNDTWGRTINENITVTVQDTTNPEWTTSIDHQIKQYGYNFSYTIGAYDAGGIKSWTLNDSINFNIISGVITNKTLLEVGYYGLNVTVFDNNDNSRSAEFNVFINDTIYPIWEFLPAFQFCQYGDDFVYDLGVIELSNVTWSVNDTINFQVDDFGEITNNIELTVRTYGIEVTAVDAHGLSITASFDLLVNDTIDPVWISEPEYKYSEFGDSFVYDLEATDIANITLWELNDLQNFIIDSNGIIENNTKLAVGNYSLHVIAYDAHGNYVEGYFIVEVRDSTPPLWPTIPVQELESGEQLSLQLNVYDAAEISQWAVNDTDRFSITEEGFLTSDITLSTGFYYVEVTATDEHGVFSTYVITIFVKIASTTSPTTSVTTATTTTTTTTEPPDVMLLIAIGGIAIGAIVLFAFLRTWRAVQRDRLAQIEAGKGEVDTALDYLESIKPVKDEFDNDE